MAVTSKEGDDSAYHIHARGPGTPCCGWREIPYPTAYSMTLKGWPVRLDLGGALPGNWATECIWAAWQAEQALLWEPK